MISKIILYCLITDGWVIYISGSFAARSFINEKVDAFSCDLRTQLFKHLWGGFLVLFDKKSSDRIVWWVLCSVMQRILRHKHILPHIFAQIYICFMLTYLVLSVLFLWIHFYVLGSQENKLYSFLHFISLLERFEIMCILY